MMTDDERRMLDCCRSAMEAQRIQHDKDIRSLETRISDLEKLMDSKFDAREQAVEAAHDVMLVRFERVEELSERMGNVENRLAVYDGRIVGYSAGTAAVALIIAIVVQLLNLGG